MSPEPTDPEASDVTRRTWLAAERTWLAWWRTGLAAGIAAIAFGRLVPLVTHGARWPFRVIGLGYAVLAVVVLAVGGLRQRRVAAALREGGYVELSSGLVTWLTVGAVLLTVGAGVLVAVRL